MLGLLRFIRFSAFLSFVSAILCSCYHPPYNNFRPYNPSLKDIGTGATVGTVVGAFAGPTLVGTGIGAAAFTAHGLSKETKNNIIHRLKQSGIQYVKYGDTMTLILPTDRYFLFDSPRLNELCYPGLNLIVKLLAFYPDSTVYVAGFTDNIGSSHHKKMLSQARAETMLTFLWANNRKAYQLNAAGYGDKYAISDNRIIHGSAQNRRIEIQWIATPSAAAAKYSAPYK